MKKPPSPEFLADNLRYAARLVEALTLLLSEHASEHHLTQGAVLASVTWVLGRLVGAIARDGGRDLEQSLGFTAQHLRLAALGEFGRRSYTLH